MFNCISVCPPIFKRLNAVCMYNIEIFKTIILQEGVFVCPRVILVFLNNNTYKIKTLLLC